MSADLILHSAGSQNLPAMTIGEAVQRRQMLVDFTKQVMVSGSDFGTIPGTNKPTLLKPGAEKLCTLFGLVPRFEIIERVENWTAEEPFFFYLYRCSLYRNGLLLAEADGSCNSFEKKYRYRKAERLCPECKSPTIGKSKAEWGGGWYCNKGRGGCGAKFAAGTEAIESQEVGTMPNPDICDAVNTIQKMAQKRALVAAALIGVNASEFFTQDLEDFHSTAETQEPEPTVPTANTETREEYRAEPQMESNLPKRESSETKKVRTEVSKRIKEIGFKGKVQELLCAILKETPTEIKLGHYQDALKWPVAEWQLAADGMKRLALVTTETTEEETPTGPDPYAEPNSNPELTIADGGATGTDNTAAFTH